ncbi:hypothetical protein ES319_A02G020500v1 [Gossypium barbadense]|uniref:Uncharacterized protein n=2 Tax=Gossypium TaxID=3633 RepID=A0A5J5WIA8_GOSBA|nr:hypothetical protein ES319_A02G020500v1 [Gossypium barbadense]TYH26840.1 hypothetical protein ES288_A02G021100v1 [Gossypium darwinii]
MEALLSQFTFLSDQALQGNKNFDPSAMEDLMKLFEIKSYKAWAALELEEEKQVKGAEITMQQAEDYFDSVMETAVDDCYEISSEDDDHLFDLDYNPYARKRPLSSRLYRDDYDETDEEEANRQKLYLVPYRWWKEAQRSVADEIVGILYNVLSNYDNADSEIVLDLRKEESSGTRVKMDEGVSSHEYALVKEALWLRTLK